MQRRNHSTTVSSFPTYIQRKKSTYSLFLHYNVQCTRPCDIIHHTSAVHRPPGGYPVPAPVFNSPNKRMLIRTIHAARRKPAIHCNYFQSALRMLSQSAKFILPLTTFRPDNYNIDRTFSRMDLLSVTFFITFMNILSCF